MKPQQPNIDWVLKNRDLVMRWLEQRGGWQEFDFAAIDGAVFGVGRETDGSTLFYNPETDQWYDKAWVDSIPIWLPSVGDALMLLDKQKMMPGLESNLRLGQADLIWMAYAGRFNSGWHNTPCIALMELLRAGESCID